MEEEQIHHDAFETYFKLRQNGTNITKAVSGVALKYNFSETTIYSWKKNFNWDDREAVRSAEINREVERKTNSTIIDNKVKYLSYIHAAMNKIIVQNPDGSVGIKLDVKYVSDMEKLIKLALLLQGEATDRTENQNDNQFNNNVQKEILEEGSDE